MRSHLQSLLLRAASGAAAGPATNAAAAGAVRGIAASPTLGRRYPPPRVWPNAVLTDPKPDLVDRLLADDALAPARVASHRAAAAAAAAAARHDGDTGSPEAQVAALTARIASLSAHLTTHKKDHASRRGLDAALATRRKLLRYLRRSDLGAYGAALARHGLKDTYTKLDRLAARKLAR